MEVDDICRYLKPFLGEKADRMWQAYQVADFEGRRQIEQYLRILSLQYLQATRDQPPPWCFFYMQYKWVSFQRRCAAGTRLLRSHPIPHPKPLIHRRISLRCLIEADRP